jgi:hypothetical protein
MSATNRGAVRVENDFYATPSWCVKRVLEEIDLPSTGKWLEPCAGEGAIIKAVDAHYGKPLDWVAVELRQVDLPGVLAGEDFLTLEIDLEFAVTIMNPPYSLAEDFIRKAISVSQKTVALLRLNWLASGKRHGFLREHTPDVYILPNRPSFTGNGTDATEYAWMVFDKEPLGSGVVKILDVTSKEDRREG